MKATTCFCVILVAAVLALGDGASLPTDNREEARKSGSQYHRPYFRPNTQKENNDMPSEMDDIQRALNQAAKSSDEYMEELKDQPTQSDENMLADRLNVLSQAGTDEYLEELKDQPKQIPSDENELADMVNVLSQAASDSEPEDSKIPLPADQDLQLQDPVEAVQAQWQNHGDQLLNVQCGNNQAFYRVKSYYSTQHRDRRWEWNCRNILQNTRFSGCQWTGWQNYYNQPLLFQCPTNKVLTGVKSVHNNRQEDRRWAFQCCGAKGYYTRNCYLTDWINNWRSQIDRTVPSPQVFTGTYSYHENSREDRKWKIMACDYIQGSTTSGDKIAQGAVVAFQTYQKNKYIGCSSTYCTLTTGPGLYMNDNDWVTHPVTGFQIYRMNGKGNVRVGEVVAIYYPKEKKWMKCSGSHCTKDTCPGRPSQGRGMENYEKWIGCSESAFKIYARGRKEGEDIRSRDDISLYHIRDRRWLSAEGYYIPERTCFGTTRPPSSRTYDTCYKEVFELFKR